MKAYTISMACEAPVLFPVPVTISMSWGAEAAPPVCGSSPGPHSMALQTCPNGVGVRLDLRDSEHSWAVLTHWCQTNTLLEPCDDRSPGGTVVRLHTCPWPWRCNTACANQPWVVFSSHPKCKHSMLGSSLCWQVNSVPCWRKGTLNFFPWNIVL